MPLQEYKRKRRFDETPEPAGKIEAKSGHRFVVQKHRASRLHYDFRLEMEGVLKSWAVPKGPSLDPADKRLAMMVEDHPVSYFHFEGTIPEGNYGAGAVMVWDTGTWEPLGDAKAMLKAGDLKFRLEGKKLKGDFVLARMRSRRPGSKGTEWLLIKKKDEHAKNGYDIDTLDSSVLTGRSLRQIAGDEGSAECTSSRKASLRKSPAKDAWLAESLRKADKKQAAQVSVKAAKKTATKAAEAKSPAAESATAVKKKENTDLTPLAKIKGAERVTMPRSIHPMLATLVDKPFDDEQWLFELKWDGFRAVAFIESGKVRLVSRNQNEFHDYPELSKIAKSIKAENAILDGEIVALDEEGRSSFSLMQQRTGLSGEGYRRGGKKLDVPILYYAFDLPYLDGYSLMRLGLEKRKELLREILTDGPLLRFSDHYLSQGKALYEAAKQRNLEGIVAKRRASCYLQKRSREWLKIKITQTQECVIGGFTDPKGSREHFGSLVLGLYDKKRLIPVGQAGSGFTQESHAEMWQRLKKLGIPKSPFAEKPDSSRGLHYVRPELVAQIKFTEWTHEGESGAVRMRAPVFQGLRSDKKPEECRFARVKSAKDESKKAASGDAA